MVDTELRKMSFSSSFPIIDNLCGFSPDGQYVGYANQNKLVVRYTGTYELFHTFSCVDLIQHFEWSSDAQYILCVLSKRATVHVFSIQSPAWRCKIKESDTGITHATWSPDSRHILTTADFHISLSVWSLVGRSVSYILQPKVCDDIARGFSGDGRWFAVVENHGKLNLISLFSLNSWQLLDQLSCPDIDDIGGLAWSPNSEVLCVWSAGIGLSEFRLSFYSITHNKWFAVYRPENYEKPFGIGTVSFSPSGQFLAVCSYDDTVRLLHHVTWQKVSECTHENVLQETNYKIYKEISDDEEHDLDENDDDVESSIAVPQRTTFVEVQERPVVITELPVDSNSSLSMMGIGLASFSNCGTYLATRNDRMPAALWIWQVKTFQLAALLTHMNPLTSVNWEPLRPRIAITTGSNSVGFWSPEGVAIIKVPSSCLGQISVSNALWHPGGKALALCAKNKMTILKLAERRPMLS